MTTCCVLWLSSAKYLHLDIYKADCGSLVLVNSILLSAESEFDGGQFTTLEADGAVSHGQCCQFLRPKM